MINFFKKLFKPKIVEYFECDRCHKAVPEYENSAYRRGQCCEDGWWFVGRICEKCYQIDTAKNYRSNKDYQAKLKYRYLRGE